MVRKRANATKDVVGAQDSPRRPVVRTQRLSGSLETLERRILLSNGTWDQYGLSATDGGISDDANDSWTPDIAVANGKTYVVWSDQPEAGDSEIYLKVWDGSSWSALGGSATGGGISNDSADSQFPKITVDSGGKPWVTWQSGDSASSRIYVKYWNGSSWVEASGSATGDGISPQVGIGGMPEKLPTIDKFARRPDIGLYQGQPMVVWENVAGATLDDIYAKYWNGSAWMELGASATGGGISNNLSTSNTPSIATLPQDGNPVVAWADLLGIYLVKWNGTNWEQIDNSANGQGLSQTTAVTRLPQVATGDTNQDIFVTYMGGDGDVFQTLGKALFWDEYSGYYWGGYDDSDTSSGLSDGALAGAWAPKAEYNSAGNPVVVWQQIGSTAIYGKQWRPDLASWEEMGGSASLGGISQTAGGYNAYPALAMDAQGEPVVAWMWSPVDINLDDTFNRSPVAGAPTREPQADAEIFLRDFNAVINHAPVANDMSVTIPEDSPPYEITLDASDQDFDPLSFLITVQPEHGTLDEEQLSEGKVVYTPYEDYAGSDSFIYKATDDDEASDTGTVSLTVSQVNDPPVAFKFGRRAGTNETVFVTLLADDEETLPEDLDYIIVTQPTLGTLTHTLANVFSFQSGSTTGESTFTWKVRDEGGLESDVQQGTIYIGDNRPPDAIDQQVATAINTPVGILLNWVETDFWQWDNLTWTITDSPDHGVLSGGQDSYTYTPTNGYEGSDTFTWRISDGEANDTATVTVNVGDLPNQAPDGTIDSPANGTHIASGGQINLLGSGTDSDGTVTGWAWQINGPSAYSWSSTTEDPGLLTLTTVGTYTITLTVTDNDSASDPTPAQAQVIVDAPGNTAPTAYDGNTVVPEDTAIILTFNATDPEGDPLAFSITGGPTNGTLINSPGTATDSQWTYTPAANWSGSDPITFKVNDGEFDSNVATFTINVSAVNDDPVAVDDTANCLVDQAVAVDVMANDWDVENDVLTVQGFTQGAHGVVTAGPGDDLTYTPTGGWEGEDTFTYTLSDGNGGTDTATVTVDVAPPGLIVYIGDGQTAEAKQVVSRDDDGTDITLSHKGGTVKVYYLGDNLQKIVDKKGVTITGDNVTIEYVDFQDDVTDAGKFTAKTKGGDGYGEIGAMMGTNMMKQISTKTIDYVGDGIVFTEDGIATKVDAHDFKNSADIEMPGDYASGVTFKVNELGAGSDIMLSNAGVKSLSAASWAGSQLHAEWAGSLKFSGDMNADIICDGTDASGNSVKSAKISGGVSGAFWTVAGLVSSVSVSYWNGGRISADAVKSLSATGDLIVDLVLDEAAKISTKGELGGNWIIAHDLGKVSGGSVAPGWEADVGGTLNSLTTSGNLGDNSGAQASLTAKLANKITIKGDVENAILRFTQGVADNVYALSKLAVSGWMKDSEVRSVGSVKDISAGGVENANLYAGVDDAVSGLVQTAGEFDTQAVLAKVSVKGISGATYSVINSNIAGWGILSASVVNPKYDNGGVLFGLSAYDFKSLSAKDSEGTWKWTEKDLPDTPEDNGDARVIFV